MLIPTDVKLLPELVSVMRELGVVSAFGVTLGPQPSRVAELTEKAAREPSEALTIELEREQKRERIEAERQKVRDMLGRNAPDEEVDSYLPAAVFE